MTFAPLLNRQRACLLGLALLAGSVQAGTSIEGQAFEDRIRLGGAELVLNGVGLRAVAWLKGYAAGLYLTAKAGTPAQVLAQAGPKRVQMKMMLDADADEFVKAIEKGLRRNHTEAERAALKERELQFIRNVASTGKLRKGDVVNLDYLPTSGLTLTLNGVVHGPPVPGADFYAGVLQIFLGERPVDKRLKAGLLGAVPE